MKVRFGILVAALAIVAFGWVGSSSPSSAGVTSSYVKFDLVGPEISDKVPRGSAKFISNAFDTRFLVTVYRTWLTTGTTLRVFVDDGTTETLLGSFNITDNHSGRLFLSVDGGATIPDITSTWTVNLKNAADEVVLWGQPTNPKYFQMYGKITGPLGANGKFPTGRITYKETDWGYARTVRVFAQNIGIGTGEVLNLYRNTADMGVSCTVTAVGLCIVQRALHDIDSVHDLTTASNLTLRWTHDDDNDPETPDVTDTVASLPAAAWVQVVPRP